LSRAILQEGFPCFNVVWKTALPLRKKKRPLKGGVPSETAQPALATVLWFLPIGVLASRIGLCFLRFASWGSRLFVKHAPFRGASGRPRPTYRPARPAVRASPRPLRGRHMTAFPPLLRDRRPRRGGVRGGGALQGVVQELALQLLRGGLVGLRGGPRGPGRRALLRGPGACGASQGRRAGGGLRGLPWRGSACVGRGLGLGGRLDAPQNGACLIKCLEPQDARCKVQCAKLKHQ
jgi:hypothetical protein